MDLEEAKAAIRKEKEDRVKRCEDRLKVVLEEERCAMQVQVHLDGLTIVANVVLVASD